MEFERHRLAATGHHRPSSRRSYGLSPVRFGYLVIAVLGALSLWRLDAVSPWLRAVPCLLTVAAGAGLAWGRWHGRPADRWLVDVCVHLRRNYSLRPPSRLGSRRRAPAPLPLPLRAIRAISSIGDGRP